MFNTHQLEQIFSENNDSPIFPILANRYYEKKLYKYAVKICEIGLNHNPENLEGLYVLAKSLLMRGQESNAAILLKKIIKQCPYHLYSTLLLVHILESTQKNQLFIKSQIKIIYNFYPNHPQVNSVYEKYFSNAPALKKRRIKKIKTLPNQSFAYNPKLATITMYKLLYTQNKLHDALAILTVLSESQSHQDFVKKEFKKIKNKLKRG
jgi:hypothetical protein